MKKENKKNKKKGGTSVAYRVVYKLLSGIVGLVLHIKVVGRENEPDDGGYVVCANHISASDPVSLCYQSTGKTEVLGRQVTIEELLPELLEDKDFYIIKVSDTGCGFDPTKPKNDGKRHVGIENVRQRLANMCDGSLTIESEVGVGTVATIKIPKGGKK